MRVVTELTRDDTVAHEVTTNMRRRPTVARTVMRDDTARLLVNHAQFDNSEETRERIRETTPAVRKIEHTIEYLDLVGTATASWPRWAGWCPGCGARSSPTTSVRPCDGRSDGSAPRPTGSKEPSTTASSPSTSS